MADVRHLLDGYRWMLAEGFADSARICLTHDRLIQLCDAVSLPQAAGASIYTLLPGAVENTFGW